LKAAGRFIRNKET